MNHSYPARQNVSNATEQGTIATTQHDNGVQPDPNDTLIKALEGHTPIVT